jgi:hypothetical protein
MAHKGMPFTAAGFQLRAYMDSGTADASGIISPNSMHDSRKKIMVSSRSTWTLYLISRKTVDVIEYFTASFGHVSAKSMPRRESAK